jgi:hypothetical protein
MAMRKFEMYVDVYEDDEGHSINSVESIANDCGDWYKASDVEECIVENTRLQNDNDRLVDMGAKLEAQVLELQDALRARA